MLSSHSKHFSECLYTVLSVSSPLPCLARACRARQAGAQGAQRLWQRSPLQPALRAAPEPLEALPAVFPARAHLCARVRAGSSLQPSLRARLLCILTQRATAGAGARPGSWGKLQEEEATGGKAEAGVKWPPGKDKFAFPRCRELNLLEKLLRKTLRKVVEAADFWD